MKKRKLASLVALVFLQIVFSTPPILAGTRLHQKSLPSQRTETPIKDEQKKLEKILKKTAAYCEILEEAAIYYYCQEKVEEIIYPIPKKYRGFISTSIGLQGDFPRFHNKGFIRNEYLYDYQLVRKGKSKSRKETRTLLRENNKEKHKKNAGLKTQLFEYRTIVYGPLVFAKKQQKYYNFNIISRQPGEEGRTILVIEVTPRARVQKKLTWGKFWVDEKDFTILKIKISQRSMGNYEEIEKKSKVLNATPSITIFLHYDIEKNGIRFPSKVLLEEIYLTAEGERILLSKINVDYNDYRFFTVGVRVKEKQKK